jgi:hypothetical protein
MGKIEESIYNIITCLILSIISNLYIISLISWKLDLQLPVKSLPIITKVVSSNPIHNEVYSIQHNVIKFVSDLRQVSGFLWVLQSLHE